MPPAAARDLPLFDAHLHYNDAALQPYPLERVLTLFRQHGVRAILANSRPNDGTRLLAEARAADVQVVPFVRPYRTRDDMASWFRDPAILELIEAELKRGYYRGIGEFHVYGDDAAGPQMKRIVDLAVARGLWLHAHVDEVALAHLFRHHPNAKVIWAHTGFSVPAARVEQLLKQHPTLMGELSYRHGITDGARLSAEWRDLFTRYSDRFLIGSDTWVNERWERYGELIADYRRWLAELPREAAENIAYRNGARLFGLNPIP